MTALAIGQLEAMANSGASTSQIGINAVFSGLGSQVVGAIIAAIGVVVLTGLLIVVLGHAVIGRTMALGEVWAAVRGRIPGLLGITAVTTLALLGIMAAGFLPLIFLALGENGRGALLLLIITLPLSWGLMVYLGTSWALATPAFILEGIPAMAALRRSRHLVGGSWWRTFGILLVAAVIAWFISIAIAVPFGIVQTLTTGAFTQPDAFAGLSIESLIIGAIASIIATTVTAPFMAGATGLLYFDQRIRKEAFDIQLTREAAR